MVKMEKLEILLMSRLGGEVKIFRLIIPKHT